MLQLLLIASSTLISEDLACIGAGLLVARGDLSFAAGVFACVLGIFAGDLLLFATGRVCGRRIRFIPADKLERASEWISRRGLTVILLSRFTPGLRLPTYVAAGVLNVRLDIFAVYLLVASFLWTPLMVGGAAVLGAGVLRNLLETGRHTVMLFIAIAAILLAVRHGRRVSAFCRRFRWEFWPPWAAYLPLLPYLLFLAGKHRSLTLFTATNPGMPASGLVGESKSVILNHLGKTGGLVARFDVIRADRDLRARLWCALDFMARLQLAFPVVMKPDVGERGSGVAIVRSQKAMEEYLENATCDIIIQEYIDGFEFGVFYVRYPSHAAGRITSITAKTFPTVIGDGRSSLRELIVRNARASCIANTYLRVVSSPERVPLEDEVVRLVELGSHCRGAIFLDAGHLNTTTLEAPKQASQPKRRWQTDSDARESNRDRLPDH